MLPNRDEFLQTVQEDSIAICGVHVGGDAVHVGIFFKHENDAHIFHYDGGTRILLQDANGQDFERYFFSILDDFPKFSVPLIAAFAELIVANKLNYGFVFNRGTPIYNGGKFNLLTGNLTAVSSVEKYVNCAVFSVAFLKSFDDFNLLNWESFPVPLPRYVPYLNDWLNKNKIPDEERPKYYNQAKELRGKHILVCPLTVTKPSPYVEINPLSQQLIDFFNI